MDKKMFHESLPDHEFGPLQTDAEDGGHTGWSHPRDAQAGPVATDGQQRHDVLTRVVRISEALNQRLAL